MNVPRFFLRLNGLLIVVVLAGLGWRWLREPQTPAAQASAEAAALPQVAVMHSPREDAPPPPVRSPFTPKAAWTGVPARLNFASGWKDETKPELAAFAEWVERFLGAPETERAALAGEGAGLAQARRAALKALIKSDPERAIAAAVPATLRARLPAEIVALLEQRVSGTGELALNAVTPAPGVPLAEPVFRTATVGGRTYRAYVYGRRLTQATRPAVAVLGVAVDGALAVSESPLRVMEAGETPAPGVPVKAACPVSGIESAFITGSQTAVETGGAIVVLCHTDHISDYEARLRRAEDAAGPFREVFSLGDSGPGTLNIINRPPVAWSQGTKKMLIIRVEFPDKTGTPVKPFGGSTIHEDFAVTEINQAGGVRDVFDQSSYLKTTLSVAAATGSGAASNSPDVTPVYLLPQTASYYAVGDGDDSYDADMHDDARALATAGGFDLNTYDRIGVVFSNLGSGASNTNPIAGSLINYGGRANVQGKNFWINGWYNFGTLTHELGHTYGLLHANLWQVSDGNPVSAAGTSTEYGDPFDPMGTSGVTIANHFNHWEKSLLQWIPDTGVTTVGTSGTYRVYRFDHQSANLANALALKIVRNGTQDYWIGFRQALTASPALLNGAYVLWGYNEAVKESNVLDMTTPGSGATDSPLAIGATFNDTAAGVTIQPLAKGGVAPNEYLDVQVTFAPRIQWSAANYSVDQKLGSVTLTVTRSNNATGAVSVNYATADGTAVAGTHYTTQSGVVSWIAGDSAPKTVTIPISTGAVFTGLKNFTVTLSGVTGGGVILNAAAVVDIASAGTGDPSFTHDYIDSGVRQVVVQPDGKLLIAGWFGNIYIDFDANVRGGFARLNADGTLDAAFGNGAGADVKPVHALALQTDGKVLIGGAFANVHGTARARVARLNSDGTLDTTFNPGTGPNDEVHALAFQPDGKILIGGKFTSVAGQTRGGIARLNADGSLDATFAGPVFLGFPNATIESIALQPDGKPVIAGGFYLSPSPWRSGVARLTTAGVLDSTFNPGFGAHRAGDTGYLQTVQKVAVQLDGKIIVGGYFTGFNSVTHNRLARLNANGTLDAAFAPSIDPGVIAGTSPYPAVRALFIQADGRIAIGGNFAQVNGTALSDFARVNADGTLDTTFAVGTGSSNWVNDFALQADGKLVLGAEWGTIQGTPQRALARLFTGVPGLSGTVQFSAPNFTGTEGNSLTVTAARIGGSYGAISVNYGTQAGTAAATRYTPAAGTLSWANGDAAAKMFTIPVHNDGIAQAEQAFSLHLGIPLGGVPLGAPGTANVAVTMAYTVWKNSRFTAAELLDSSTTGDLADPDRDGIGNQLEWSFGFEPKAPNFTSLPSSAIQNVGGSNYLTLTFRRLQAAGELTYTPQSGAPIGTWTGAPIIVGTPISNGDGTQTVTFRDSVPITAATPQRYIRLQVTRSP